MSATTFMLLTLAVSATPVDFDTEIVPILTKAGCNAAACHGSAAGRGGLKLSLFGGDAKWDHVEIVHRLEGRRVNLASPESSLVLLKPTEYISHEGGTRFEDDSPEAETIRRWIEEGAQRTHSRKLVGIEVSPSSSFVDVNDVIQLRVVASFDDNTQRDVTDLAVFTPLDEAAVAASTTGSLQVPRRGRHHVIVRFLTALQTVAITVPLGNDAIDLANSPRKNWIDDEILKTLSALRLAPSSQADEATLFRRLSLHLTGRLPQPSELLIYLEDDDPNKFDRLVDKLLNSAEFEEYWTFRLSRLLRINPQQNNLPATQAFHEWVRLQLRDRTGWNKIATDLITAEGDTHEYGPANFYSVAGDARAQAEYASELLMGVRLSCANCHNHPLDRWTQDDYHGLAAIFAQIDRGRHIKTKSSGRVIHPVTGEAAIPRIPGEQFIEEHIDTREALAEWLTAKSNPYFSRAIVNRIWKALMGRGLVEPTDDLRATNPASHPVLLAKLEDEFVKSGYSLHHIIKSIVSSAAYARSSRSTLANEGDQKYYSHALATKLEPEVLADAIADVTQVPEQYGDQPLGTRAIALFTPPESETLEILGRCDRSMSCEATDSSGGGLTTKLHLMNGALLNQRLKNKDSRLTKLLQANAGTSEVVNQFYLAALSRMPSENEQTFWATALESENPPSRHTKLQDFVWAILNSQEFLTNH